MKKITTRNTKSEIIAAYNALSKELRAAKAKGNAPAQKALPPSPTAKEATSKGSSELSIADIIRSLRGLTTHIGESASTLQGELTAEATQLEEIREQANAVTADLEALHGITVTERGLADLIERYASSNEEASVELDKARASFEEEMTIAKAQWAAERKTHSLQLEDAQRERKQARKRDVTEHGYELEQRKAAEQDERAQQSKQFEQELLSLREAATARFTERENALAEAERELAELEAKAAAFEQEREAAVKKAEHEGIAIAKRQAKTELDLKNKDNEGTIRVFDLQIAALGETITKQEAQIDQLSRQLEDARKQTTELAVKAIDGASNATSFQAVKEIALEQAKNTPKGK